MPVNAHYECTAYVVAQYEWLDTSLSFDQPLHLEPSACSTNDAVLWQKLRQLLL